MSYSFYYQELYQQRQANMTQNKPANRSLLTDRNNKAYICLSSCFQLSPEVKSKLMFIPCSYYLDLISSSDSFVLSFFAASATFSQLFFLFGFKTLSKQSCVVI